MGLKRKKTISPPRRTPSGRISQAGREKIEAVVLAQPHRRGDKDQLCESPLGRFCKRRNLPREYYDAAERYASLRARFLAVMGAPKIDRPGGIGLDVPLDLAREWKERLDAMEDAMCDAGGVAGLGWVGALTLERYELPANHPAEEDTERALKALEKMITSRA